MTTAPAHTLYNYMAHKLVNTVGRTNVSHVLIKQSLINSHNNIRHKIDHLDCTNTLNCDNITRSTDPSFRRSSQNKQENKLSSSHATSVHRDILVDYFSLVLFVAVVDMRLVAVLFLVADDGDISVRHVDSAMHRFQNPSLDEHCRVHLWHAAPQVFQTVVRLSQQSTIIHTGQNCTIASHFQVCLLEVQI